MQKIKFDYSSIPAGFYDKVLLEESGIRSFWHYQKFDAVLRSLSSRKNGAILDIGCSAGSFLNTLEKDQFSTQYGVDLAPDQIKYAQKYQTNFRKFLLIENANSLQQNFSEQYFDAITLIEVTEHLDSNEINAIFSAAAKILKTDGELVITTPNYLSLWPILEKLMAWFIKPSYEEQHITKFTYFNFAKKMREIYPDFDKNFTIEFQASSHFALFFLAAISYKLAKYLSRFVGVKKWKMPFGALLVVKMRKI